MKGGNNAVYFLLNNYEGTGCMKTSNLGGIIISVDNFSGKNNNRIMIWFIVKYLVLKKRKDRNRPKNQGRIAKEDCKSELELQGKIIT